MFSIALITSLTMGADPQTDEMIQSAKRSISNRQIISRYHIELSRESTWDSETEAYKLSIWDDGKHRRTDSLCEVHKDEKNVGLREITCRNFDRKGYVLNVAFGPKRVRIADYMEINELTNQTDMYHIDWRYIGFTNGLHTDCHFLRVSESIESINKLLSIKKEHVEMKEVEHRKQKCLLMEVKIKGAANPPQNAVSSDSTYKIWLSSNYGYCPIEFELTTAAGIVQKTTIEYNSSNLKDDYFPKKISYSQSTRAKQLVSEKIEITKCELNKVIDPKVFTLKNLNLKNGIRFCLPELEGKPYEDLPFWKDGQLVPSKQDKR